MIAYNLTDVIIVTYYTGEILFDCLKTVIELDLLNRVIIVNNGNPIEVENKLYEIYKNNEKIIFITGHGNIGFSKACNLASTASNAKYLLFLNPDCIVLDKKTIYKFIQILSQGKYQIASCLILNHDDTIQKTCRRNLLTPLTAVSESLCLYKVLPFLKPLNRSIYEIDKLPDISEIEALSGAVIFTSRDYYKEIGGFSEEFFLHVEDMDLSMKIHLRGDKIAFLKNIKIKHLLSTSKTTKKFLEKHKAKGFIIYLEKYFPIFNRKPIKIFLQILIWFRFIVKMIF